MYTIKKILRKAGKFYTDTFAWIFKGGKPEKGFRLLQKIYCSGSYYLTRGGVISRMEE